MIYRFSLKPRSALGTPFRSDTLFGHACWTVRFCQDEERLKVFLDAARAQKPELVFSDGFPAGYLPKPLLPARIVECNTIDDYRNTKKLAKLRYVERKEAENAGWKIDTSFLPNKDKKYAATPEEFVTMHNVIDRLTGTSLEENGLFSRVESGYVGIWEKINIYVSTSWPLPELNEFLRLMFTHGYGRDQTVGLGSVEIDGQTEAAAFPVNNSGFAMSLSRVVPDKDTDIKQSFYELEPKYGKVWSGLGENNPFKKTIMQAVPGSVFYCGNNKEETIGTVLTGVHDCADVIENCQGICYPLPETALEGVPNG